MELTDIQKDAVQGIVVAIETDDELKYLAKQALAEIVSRKQIGDSVLIQNALLKYDETNELGKRIYTIHEVSKLTGVSAAKISKALKALEELEAKEDDETSESDAA